jgi:serine/threonine-protein kinase
MSQSKPGDSFQPGDLLNNTYRVEAILGRGGTSEVYLARSEISGRRVAVKALRAEYAANADYLVLMTREEDVRDIRHDSVVRYYDNQRTPEGQVYLVMDYVDGPGLDAKLKAGGMPADELLTLAGRVAGGLSAAHAHNIIHRDLSPDNIILQDGDPAQAVIIDFGIAKDTKPGAETIVGNEFAGKYAYAAPEQLSGKTDARSDIYSLGALLLAAFRGATPEVGSNPMEVVRRKTEPLDTSGVPEPLKSLIDHMTAPDPENRLQSAEAVLQALSDDSDSAEDLSDKTVIAPAVAVPTSTPPLANAKPEAKPEKRGNGGIIALVLVIFLAIGAGGAYFGGLLDTVVGPTVPTVSPYVLTVRQSSGGSPVAQGHVPSEETRSALADLLTRAGGEATVEIASGDISDTWGQDTISLIDKISPLDEFLLVIDGNTATLTGVTNDRALRATLLDSLNAGLPGALTGSVDILQGPLLLPVQTVRAIVADHADCGPLTLGGQPSTGFGPDNRIEVTGNLAQIGSRQALFDALREVSGDRDILIDTEILNPSLCLIETALPKAPSGDFRFAYRFGDRDEPNPTGRFLVGDNPVIDVVIPSSITGGFIWVSILDVSGNVFHLLPNVNRKDNSVENLRGGQSGDVAVRVAFPVSDAADPARLAFLVDDSTLGKSKIMVLHSNGPLFDELRPTTESAAGYAQALGDRGARGAGRVQSLDSDIIVTDKP